MTTSDPQYHLQRGYTICNLECNTTFSLIHELRVDLHSRNIKIPPASLMKHLAGCHLCSVQVLSWWQKISLTWLSPAQDSLTYIHTHLILRSRIPIFPQQVLARPTGHLCSNKSNFWFNSFSITNTIQRSNSKFITFPNIA